MKVYELMNGLAKMPAGAVVRIRMIKDLKEMPVCDGTCRRIDFEVREVSENGKHVEIDGWDE